MWDRKNEERGRVKGRDRGETEIDEMERKRGNTNEIKLSTNFDEITLLNRGSLLLKNI